LEVTTGNGEIYYKPKMGKLSVLHCPLIAPVSPLNPWPKENPETTAKLQVAGCHPLSNFFILKIRELSHRKQLE